MSLSSAWAGFSEGQQAYKRGDINIAVALWRKAAWRSDDLLSQVRLGELYRDGECVERASDKNSVCVEADPIEAYVWFYLASVNVNQIGLTFTAFQTLQDVRYTAFIERDRLFYPMVPSYRMEAHNRVVYVLASRGAEGFFRLGEIYDERQATDNQPLDTTASPTTVQEYNQFRTLFSRPSAQPSTGPSDVIAEPTLEAKFSASGIVSNNAEALAYYIRSKELSHPVAASLEASLRSQLEQLSDSGAAVIRSADDRASRWQPPFEYYPAPHSDESDDTAARVMALARIHELRLRWVQHSLRTMGYYKGDIDGEPGPKTRQAKILFQGAIGAERTGILTAEQTVRLVQTAADRNSSVSQNTLGTMYYKGVGEPVDYTRALYWFEKSAEQNYPYALHNLGVMYRDGRGVPKNLERAENYFNRARLAGYGR